VAAVVRRRRIGFVAAFLVGRDPWVVAFLFWAGILYTGISIEIFYINKTQELVFSILATDQENGD